MLFTSAELEKIWGKGFCIVGNVTYESAAYVARYVYKKAYDADEIPIKQHKQKEFTTCSKRPAISKNFYFDTKKWKKILRNSGVLVPTKSGLKIKPIPQYLKKKWKENERESYFAEQEQQKKIMRQTQKELLSKTDKNFGWYRRQHKEIKLEQLKRLDKRTDLW